jgi:hypothetical protein
VLHGGEEGTGRIEARSRTHEATVLEETEQIVILSVDVTADLDGRLELEQDRLGDEN